MEDETRIELTASQSQTHDNLDICREAAHETLKVAFRCHSRSISKLMRKERKLWNELFNTHDLDIKKTWTLEDTEGKMYIVAKD